MGDVRVELGLLLGLGQQLVLELVHILLQLVYYRYVGLLLVVWVGEDVRGG